MVQWGLLAALGAGVLSFLGTRTLIPLLRHREVLDHPNERSLHATPTPRGGGIALIAAILLGWAAATAGEGPIGVRLVIPLATCFLAIVSWLDDLHGLAPAWRLLAQLPAVIVGIAVLPASGDVFQGWLGFALDRAAAGLLWLWFINLYNFMDGIDGLDGSETVAIGLGLTLFAAIGVGADADEAVRAACIACAALGFLVWNWSPARIFLGDVGSVPLGYLLGFLLLDLAARGWWKVTLILPLYFFADATITLARRLLRGERIWRPHREHFYQRAVQRGLSHAAVVRRVIAADLGLIACGWAAENGYGVAALAAAAAIVAILLADLAGGPHRARASLSRARADSIPAEPPPKEPYP
jgi:UDP-N-acetylmuramyl pentapeptide phosphotransferase/UDP-N-acetylglucosamine-1-phosphate transferase